MTYAIELRRDARRALQGLPIRVTAAILQFIQGPLAENPHRVGKSLRFELEGHYSARRGSYRVIYRIVEERVVVEVIRIAHRRDAYRA